MEAVQAVVDGKEIEARIVTNESTFTSEQAKEALPSRQY